MIFESAYSNFVFWALVVLIGLFVAIHSPLRAGIETFIIKLGEWYRSKKGDK